MNVEENRLRTFSDWPVNAAVDPARIAKAGFYYTGSLLEVQCFLCGAKISEWNYGDQVMARHRQLQPNCPFVQNPLNTCNVPLVGSPHGSSSIPPLSPASLQPDTENQRPISSLVQSENPQVEYRTEAQRLQSFTNWPIPSIISPERLAKSGFYYLQQADVVECAFCRGVIRKWEAGDDPDRVHRISFPTCDFYMHQDDNEVVSAEKVELGNVKLSPGATSNFKELGIQAHTAPRQPKHATFEGRLRTFQGWPENLRQTPEMLAQAGFYYVGSGDQVRCFHCDGGLRNWEVTDDAWTEHAKWFPRCGFVALVRGQEFIRHCVENRPSLDPSIFEGVSEDEGGEVSETPPVSLSTVSPLRVRQVTEAELEELLNTSPALAALEVGLHVGRVKRALKKRMETYGVPYTNPDQLIEDVLHIQCREDDNISTESHTPDSPSSELTNLLSSIINAESSRSSQMQRNQPDNVVMTVDTVKDNTKQGANLVINKETKDDADAKKITDKKKNLKDDDESSSLQEENRRLKEARLCKICMDREVAVVFLPCGHLATCVHCAPSLTHCPMCRQEIRATVRTFLA
ncbi:baculoviral IAP repeat-containing protein 7-A [Cephus cinctus]|uniref:Baculoviral IAP repeat-containing protein 7-A n=1 Tax=Cephus cinctus TaxID=211228 RepID=A0AAJ7C1M5_CEPCN|nr:baculoviral IAP repeat-containing protein 7-A [Cephus cinctus]